ncbi:pyocin knob domain-containing protein [Weissella sagaensis]|uniref:pyocin knob domain-containing protein n=1 Tax=Weissella sagaensis TaxID=2559928 RepID=UPI0013ECF12A|nr:pyocin knob domain-containing protein [Weissella sagaensis]
MANKFTNFKFTTEGKDTLTEVLAAKGSIAITQVYTFETKLTDTLVFTQLSSLGPKQIKSVGTVSAQSNTVETRLQIDNADLTSDYNLQGIALVGTFNKTNFVLGYINTNEATNVPAFRGNQVQTIALDVSFAISDTSVITINTQTAGMLTVADYNALVAYIKDQVAPLSVDKKVVHLTNNEIIDGIKTFKQKITGSISGNANTVDYINIHQITANIDLNTLTTNGNYLSTLETKTTSNKPGGTSEQYTLISNGNIQVFNDIKTDKTYIRNYIKSDTFTSWKVVIEDIDQTLNAQFNFTKVPTVNSKPVAIQADLQTETTNRTNADKTINNSLTTEVSDRKSGDTINANAIQAEATARSQADSSATVALNTEKTTRSSADATLTKAVSDTQADLQTEVANRTSADKNIANSAVHKTGNESITGNKTFSNDVNVNHIMQADWFYKHVRAGATSSPIMEVMDDNLNDGSPHPVGKYYSGYTHGNGVSISGYGLTGIGGGESINSIFDLIVSGGNDGTALPIATMGDKSLILASDQAIYFLQGQQNAPNYTNIWRLNTGGYWDRYDGTSQKWINVIPNVSNLLAQDDSVVHNSGNENISGTKSFGSTINGDILGNAGSANKLLTARTIGGVKFDGTANINLPGVNTQGNQDTTGNASTADKLHTARTIGGVSFDGGSNINLPGVNTAGNQNTTGNAATATKLQTARKINGTAFDGTKDINVNAANDSNLVHQSGNETVAGYKTFNNRLTVKGVSQADYFYKTVTSKDEVPILEFDDSSDETPFRKRLGSYYSQDSYGGGIALSAGGLTVIGGGESPFSVINKIKDGTVDSTAIPASNPGSEDMIVASDQSIYFLPNFQNANSYTAMWRMTQGGYLQNYNGKSWVNVLPSNSGLVAQDSAVVHNSGNENITGTKTFSSTISGSVSGNAGSANKLTTARKINGVNFNGTGDINVKASNDSDIVHKSSNETIGGNNTFSGSTTFKNNVVLQGNVSSRSNATSASIKYQSVIVEFYETAVGVQVSIHGAFDNLTAKGRATYLKIGNIPSNITNPGIITYASSASSSGVDKVTNNTGVHVDFVFDTNGEVGIYAGHTLTNKTDAFNNLWTEPRASTYWIK